MRATVSGIADQIRSNLSAYSEGITPALLVSMTDSFTPSDCANNRASSISKPLISPLSLNS